MIIRFKMNEQKLIRKLRKGKTKAYKHLFSEYYDWLCNYIFQLCHDRSLSEDIVQETLVNFWEKRKQIVITSSLKNYLFRSCHNRFLQHIRKESPRFDTLDKIQGDIISETSWEDDQFDFKMKKLNELIDQLPPRCKEIFVQNKLEKKKYKEIALNMGISIKTVENQMSKALHFLKEHATMFLL